MMSRRNRLSLFVSAFIVAAWAVSAAHAQSVLIKPKYTLGDKHYLEQNTQIKQKMSGGPMGEAEFNIQRIYGLWQQVESASDKGAKITMTYDRAMQAVQSPMMEAAFDSDDPENEDASPFIKDALKALVGGTFKMEIDADNKVGQFSGMKDVLDKVQEAAPASPFMMQLQQELTDERGKVTWGEEPYLMYPNKEVKVGEKWLKLHHDTIPQLGKVVSHFEYKLDHVGEEAGRKVAVVTYTSTLEKDHDSKSSDENKTMKAEVKGSFSGADTYDIEKGIITKHTSDGKINVHIKQGKSASDDEDEDDDDDAPKSKKKKPAKKDDDQDDDSSGGMKFDISVKHTVSIMSEAERNKQKAEAAKKQAATGKKDEVKKPPAKKAEPPKKKPKDEDDDDDE